MLYTKKGDDGMTKLFNCVERLPKSAKAIEALGTLDELNAILGWCKLESAGNNFVLCGPGDWSLGEVLSNLQQDLFILQAQLAGADKRMSGERVSWLEEAIARAEKELPKISTFIVSGGTRVSALLDVARTIARRAERRLVETREEGRAEIDEAMLSYLNRLSSTLYALARFVNAKAGIEEEKPHY
jgi:cob(I)alamin adenosyltransferase